jgi:hypothetical protein
MIFLPMTGETRCERLTKNDPDTFFPHRAFA